MRDDMLQCVIRYLKLAFFQTSFEGLSPNKIAPGDLYFFLFGVARQTQDFHSIEQRLGNRVGGICRGNEENSGKIEWQIKVIVAESFVLLRIKYLEQRRRRVSAKVAAQLVHFIEHEHRVIYSRPANGLYDAPRHSSDVGAPVSPELSFVVKPAQAEPLKLPPDSACDRLTQAGLADAGRPDKT